MNRVACIYLWFSPCGGFNIKLGMGSGQSIHEKLQIIKFRLDAYLFNVTININYGWQMLVNNKNTENLL